MQDKTLSYHNDANLKKLVIEEMKKHQKQDQLIKGSYRFHEREKFKGCAIGCVVNSICNVLGKDLDTNSHSILQEFLGFPLWLSKIQDDFFECLPNDECDKFAIDFLESIPVGIDLEPVRWKLCAMLLREGIEIIQDKENLAQDIKDETLEALNHSLCLYESAIKSNGWNLEFSNEHLKKMEKLVLKASIHFPYNESHIANMAYRSIKVDDESMHRMFFSASVGAHNGRLSSEAIGNAYVGHANQLLSLLKNSEHDHAQQ